MPGAPAELDLFGDYSHNSFIVPQRSKVAGVSFDALSDEVATSCFGERIRLVAFSLGARPALDVAYRLGPQVGGIDLIAPAAPLETGHYNDMAGWPVFKAAQTSPRSFAALVAMQSLVARVAPWILYRMLFAKAKGADQALATDPQFRAAMTRVLSDCFVDGGRNYREEITRFVEPWAGLLAKITAPVTLWHGTADNWAPIAMTEAFAAALPNVAAVNRLRDLSHYSTLRVALIKIMEER